MVRDEVDEMVRLLHDIRRGPPGDTISDLKTPHQSPLSTFGVQFTLFMETHRVKGLFSTRALASLTGIRQGLHKGRPVVSAAAQHHTHAGYR